MRTLGIRGIPDGRLVTLPSRALQWTGYSEVEPWATVEIRLELSACGGTAWLRYDIEHYSHRTGPQEYAVSLVTTPCRFGGLRWWWLCPATRRRVTKLYLPNGGYRFLSRGPGAYRLAYASQRQAPTDRMHQRSRKLYARLGADYGGQYGGCWPPKPSGMRWRTYESICNRLNAESEGLNISLLRVVERLMRFHK